MFSAIRCFSLMSFLIVASISLLGCQKHSEDSNEPSPNQDQGAQFPADTEEEKTCMSQGWEKANFLIGSLARRVLWKGPSIWNRGTILVLHGGGGKASDFCVGGPGVQPQIEFANLAVSEGFGVILLESTDGLVTDAQGRACGKRFDFSVLNRDNIDLPYIQYALTDLVTSIRPAGSSGKLFMTGLSTGGYMTTRAASHFDNLVTAFAPVSAGDPYGTDTVCDPSLSPRDSAVGILKDRETNLEITDDDACTASTYSNESPWESSNPSQKPIFKTFLHPYDGIVDLSCKSKVRNMLLSKGYTDGGYYSVPSTGPKNVGYHLWLYVYNTQIINFFKSVN